MTNPTKLFQLTQLAEASYANFENKPDKTALTDNEFSNIQADEFLSHWSIASHQANTVNGFSATLFEDKSHLGTFTLAFRGTELPGDIINDLYSADIDGIAITGAAFLQIVDLYNYWQRLTTAASVHYIQAELVITNTQPGNGYIYSYQVRDMLCYVGIKFSNSQDYGLEKLSATAQVDVTGHSLGGHLAVAFARLFPNNTRDILTANGAGFGGNLLDAFFNQLAGHTTSFVKATETSNLFGEIGPELITSNVIFNQYGDRGAVPIVPVANIHSVSAMTDSLAVLDLFIKLDATLNNTSPTSALNRLESLFEQSTNQAVLSLETLVAGLSELILGSEPTIVTDDRDSLYSAINNLNSASVFNDLIGKVTLTEPPTSASEARSDFGAFLSLVYLTPFALKANDTTAALLLETSNPVNTELALQWKQDNTLTSAQLAGGSANYTDTWLADRAAMLSWQNQLNALDVDVTAMSPYITHAGSQHFKDITSGKEIFINGLVEESQDFVFGSNTQADVISGHNKNDHLYGLDGNDTISGGKGDDWLEGNAGEDTLEGGSGADTLIGGTGNDQLQGGADNDLLQGGLGNDTYIFQAGDGFDTLLDTDGLGKIQWDSLEIKGSNTGGLDPAQWQQLNNTFWQDQANHIVYTLKAQADGSKTLFINKAGGQLRVDRWLDGNLGITLGAVNGVSTAIHIYNGDQRAPLIGSEIDLTVPSSNSSFNTFKWSATSWAADGTLNGGIIQANFNDVIAGSSEADSINGLGGNDALDGRAGNDVLDGGEGNDLIAGGAGSDVIYGGAGNDMIVSATGLNVAQRTGPDETWQASYGKAVWIKGSNWGVADAGGLYNFTISGGESLTPDNAPDSIFAGAGDDRVIGGLGDDYMDGGLGNDLLVGHGGSDILDGGDGDDYMQGDGQVDPGYYESVAGANNGNDYLDGGAGMDYLMGCGKDDVLFGGIGNDLLWGDQTSLPGQFHGNDYLDAGDGDDQLVGGGMGDTLIGGGGKDSLYGDDVVSHLAGIFHGNDTLEGGESNDTLFGGGKDDTLFGGTGNDLLWGDDESETYLPGQYHGKDHLDGGEGNDQLVGGGDDDMLIGGGGNDTLFGDDSLTNLAAYYHGNDYLDGGEGNDQLVGGGGNDTLLGGAGIDLLLGEDGNDTLEGGDGDDLSSANGNTAGEGGLSGGAGDDRLYGGAGRDELDGGEGFDLLDGGTDDDLLFGGTGDDTLYGGDGNDELYGEGGNDILEGGAGADYLFGQSGNDTLIGGAGADYLSGGSGNDTYVVDNAMDYVDEALNQGTETIQSSISYMLGANVENLTLTGTIAINATGNALNNILTGNSAANTLTGGAGDDTYVIGKDDLVVEAFGKGTDKVLSSITYTLTDNVENLTLTGTEAISGTGNSLNNVLVGNSASNTLSGGAGTDSLIGGNGDDTYVIDAGDIVVEAAGAGIDTAQTGITYTLTDNVENLNLTGTTAINGTGNTLNNVLTGNSAANTLTGGAGDDTYIIGTGDTVVETADAGIDTIQSGITYALGANVENLILIGSSAINGTGNALDNILTGNSAANTLSGGDGADTMTGDAGNDILNGGLGTDTMSGGLGDDSYYLDNAADALIENAGEGNDIVYSSIDYTLSANLERLYLTGNGAINATGNELNNTLYGHANSAANTLSGGLGNDVYYTGAGDNVIENAGEGTDSVYSYGDYTLGDNVENLYLNVAGSAKLTGNALANSLRGNAGNDTLSGGDGNDTLNGGLGADTMSGGLGDDSYYLDNADDAVIENAGEGNETVYSSISYTLGANLERLYLTGSEAINATGNELNNTLYGHANSAANTVSGGLGNDVYYTGAGDNVIENAGEGTDSVYSYGDYTLGDNVENLYLNVAGSAKLTGNALANSLRGNAGNDTLSGGDGNDTLNGGLGADTMSGGLGDDSYYLDNAADAVIENAGEGNDIVYSSIDYTLSANLERLYLTGNGAINATGNELNNTLYGHANSAANTLSGGLGNDVYYTGAGDNVIENAGEGTDSVYSYGDYTLGDNVENLYLNVAGSAKLTGNALANSLRGNAGNDTLSGGDGNDTLNGGLGADTMSGGLGDDSYYLDNAADAVIENAGEGNDIVYSSIDYTLGANLERLYLTGSKAISATGNELNNTLYGHANSAVNTLSGGLGNDIYYAGAGDNVIENAGEGTDSVYSYGDYSLSDNIENLTLTGALAINGSGNELNNVLTGNNEANVLIGGAGNDTLNGGAGADTLDGGSGNDKLSGGGGNDTYLFGRGSGTDVLCDYDLTLDNIDVLTIDSGVAPDQLWFRRAGSDLAVGIIGTMDKNTISNWYSGRASHIEQFKTADGKMLLDSQVDALVSAMAAFAPPAAGQTTLPPDYQAALAPVIAANWK